MADRDGPDGYIAGEQGPASRVQRLAQRYRSWPLWAKISAPVAALFLMSAFIPNDQANSTAGSPATTQVAAATVVTRAATTSTSTTSTLAPVTTIPATTLPATTLPATTLAPVTTPAPAPEPVVAPAPAPIAPQPIVVIPAPAPVPAPAPAPAAVDARYDTCKEAKAHGAGPYYAGTDVEYNWYRDADNDGIVCE